MGVSPTQVLEALKSVVDPNLGKDVVRLNLIRRLNVGDERISFEIVLRDPTTDFASECKRLCEEAIRDAGITLPVNIEVDSEMISLGDDLQVDGGAAGPVLGGGVVNTIAVASGKGGVGKSTVAVNLAVALAAEGYDVGLVDTDIYGPSIPTMLGVRDARPRVDDDRKIIPVESYGVKLLSMGFLVDENKAVIWRGPMVTSAIRQFLGETSWGDLDFLVLDLPPGTGDIQLTIVQTVSLSGAVIVSTPQEVALADARKGVAMFQQVNVPVLGIVENMAYFSPPDAPEKKYHLFGEGGARRLADQLEIPFLGEIPIVQQICEHCDAGTPVAATLRDEPIGEAFGLLARNVVKSVELRNADLDPTQKVEILHR
ncbi:MAG: Mrp/NBP35 family ATP-binding protein [Rhodothermia bacterium]|nr:Mrp/NBP35 family ATP-binding protein [Rhodothermia bacterium]